jgi:hypothetical protein
VADGDSDVRILTLSVKVPPVTGILKVSEVIEVRWFAKLQRAVKDETTVNSKGIG